MTIGLWEERQKFIHLVLDLDRDAVGSVSEAEPGTVHAYAVRRRNPFS